ncbi:MAG TPA: hypothetical protein VLB29_04115 [Nocardioidaceae bacterium]|nr:hypothetical protein [Nocardioidaceae bacterium]
MHLTPAVAPALAGNGGISGTGPGVNSLTAWVVGFVVVLLLAGVAWWATRRPRR